MVPCKAQFPEVKTVWQGQQPRGDWTNSHIQGKLQDPPKCEWARRLDGEKLLIETVAAVERIVGDDDKVLKARERMDEVRYGRKQKPGG